MANLKPKVGNEGTAKMQGAASQCAVPVGKRGKGVPIGRRGYSKKS